MNHQATAPGDEPRFRHAHPEPRSDWDIEYEPPETKRSLPMLLALILISVGLAAVAQLTLKHGMNQVVEKTGKAFRLSGPSVRAVVGTPAVWIGLTLFALSAAVWLAVLSRASLSFAYPFAALTYVLIVLFDKFILRDPVPALRWAGVALIVGGILLVARTPHDVGSQGSGGNSTVQGP